MTDEVSDSRKILPLTNQLKLFHRFRISAAITAKAGLPLVGWRGSGGN
jgi:hypothetical protein